ncbi:hypothetical protein EG68_06569 [Paragonimus skrjabini miyazakii]|uniref:Uncharacterized protein n=1 Tax=Paragonimus skrjabini miyazakii TaxID=59628 RepID=A0A8S9YQ23_9TREM|nr:hypothetical protein EG68_06569 [Paragonimus skrjabini miyazakii]
MSSRPDAETRYSMLSACPMIERFNLYLFHRSVHNSAFPQSSRGIRVVDLVRVLKSFSTAVWPIGQGGVQLTIILFESATSQSTAFQGPKDGSPTMSTRRTTVVPTTAAEDEIKQATVDVYSYSGSHISNKSVSSMRSQQQIIELKEKYIDEELQLELLEAKLRHRRELLKIRKEAELARAGEGDIEFEQASDLSIDNASRIRGYIDDCQAHVGQNSTIGLAVHTPPDARATAVNNAVASALQPLVKGLKLPRVELAYFDGNPIEYWKFMRQFEFYVESKVADDGQCLLYLLHYCKGRAKEAISECIMLPSTSSFERARRMLVELFGQTHHLARSLLDRLLNESNAVVNSSDALSALAVKMENCHIALTEMNYAADLNSLSTLEKSSRDLPRPLQFQWAEVVDKITFGGREPSRRCRGPVQDT